MVEHSTFYPKIEGSNPTIVIKSEKMAKKINTALHFLRNGCHDIEHNDTHQNDILRNETQPKK